MSGLAPFNASRLSKPSPGTIEDGYVYVRQVGEAVKIGVTSRPDRLGAGVLLVLQGGRKVERYIHRRLKAHRIEGELFRVHQDVLDLIRNFTQNGVLANSPGNA